MAIALKSVDELQEHLLGVFERSDHHAGEVNEVLLAIAGGILWRKNAGAHVRVSEKDGAGGNVIWFRVGLQRYALLYSHRARRIELMFGGRRGHLVHTFTNSTSLAEVAQVFSTLGMNDDEAQAYLAARAELKAKSPKGHKGRAKKAPPVAIELPEAAAAPAVTKKAKPVKAAVAAAADAPAPEAAKPRKRRSTKANPKGAPETRPDQAEDELATLQPA
ncbi:hypothetical protein [Ideonella sp.]|uniref:hypothetical protein n=1 Tax=Ideonella sp. TaxID=1929293 RepID=UPI0035B15720